MADACVEMVFHYKGIFTESVDGRHLHQPFSLLQAPSKQYRRYTTTESFGIFGVYLYPFAISQLFGITASELADTAAGMTEFDGQEGKNLEEQIILAGSTAARVKFLCAFLEKKLAIRKIKEQTIHHAIRQVVHAKELKGVETLAREFNISKRQFERKFKEHAGFSPKLYSRIIRFQLALKQYGDTSKYLTDIAHECGYYDQSHFIHDFRSFSGYHPKQYFLQQPEGIEWRES